MSVDNKFIRCEPDDPNRCQGLYKSGQCPYLAMPNCKFCFMHNGPAVENSIEESNKRLYNLGKWSARVGQIADHQQVKSLREEVGIARLLLESIMQKCGDEHDLLLYSPQISELVIRIEKLVTSMHRLEASTSMLLDKSTALTIGTKIIDIISNYVSDENALEAIGNGIIDLIVKAQVEKK